jgi:hypothetical protein
MIRPSSACLEPSELGLENLLEWLRRLVAEPNVLREGDPHYADITLDSKGALAQPAGRPLLRKYGGDPVFE